MVLPVEHLSFMHAAMTLEQVLRPQWSELGWLTTILLNAAAVVGAMLAGAEFDRRHQMARGERCSTDKMTALWPGGVVPGGKSPAGPWGRCVRSSVLALHEASRASNT